MTATVHTNAPMPAPAHVHYTTTGLDNRKVAIWAFIGSECMLFASLISTYLIYKGRSRVGPFPHESWTNPTTGQTTAGILDIPVTSASTFVLLASSFFMVMALHAVQTKHLPKRTRGDVPTVRPMTPRVCGPVRPRHGEQSPIGSCGR